MGVGDQGYARCGNHGGPGDGWKTRNPCRLTEYSVDGSPTLKHQAAVVRPGHKEDIPAYRRIPKNPPAPCCRSRLVARKILELPRDIFLFIHIMPRPEP